MISLDRRKVVGIVGGYSSLFKGGEIPTGESYGIDVAAVRKLLQKAEPPLKTESARATLAMRKLFHAR